MKSGRTPQRPHPQEFFLDNDGFPLWLMMSCYEIHDIFRLKNSGLMATRSPVTTQMWSRTTTQLDTISTAFKQTTMQTTLWITMQISTMPQSMTTPIITKHSLGSSQTMFSVWGWRKNTLLVWNQPAAAFVKCNMWLCKCALLPLSYNLWKIYI